MQVCEESKLCPSLVSTLRHPHRRDSRGCAHPPTTALLGSLQLPPPPSLAAGPPALRAIRRWQPDQTKTSAHVGSCSREGHVTRELRTPITTPTSSAAGAGPPLSFPTTSGPATHFPLPIPEPGQLLLVLGISLSLVKLERLHLLPGPLVFSSSLRNSFFPSLLPVQLLLPSHPPKPLKCNIYPAPL